MSLLKKLAGETALYGLSSILGRVLTFVFLTPFLTRVFADDRAQMGIQTDLYAWTAFLMVIFTYRMETAFFRFGSKKENRAVAYSTAKRMLLGTTLILTSLLILFAQPIATWLKYPNHSDFVIYFALILGFDALCAVPFALLRLEGKALRFASIKLLNLFIHLGLVLFFLGLAPTLNTSWYDPNMGVGYVFIANLVASAATLVFLLPTYFYTIEIPEDELLDEEENYAKPVFDRALLREMLIYALPLIFAGFAGIINEVLDRIILKKLLPGTDEENLVQLGIYGACYKIAIMMNLFTQAFNYAAEPFFFRNADKKFANQFYANIAFLFALVGCFGFLGITLFMDLAQYFVADSFREGLIIVPLLLLANLCLGLYYNIAIWYKLSSQTKYGAYIALSGAAVTIIANFALIPLMPTLGYPGYLGSAWATLFCYLTMLVLAYSLGQRHYPIPYPLQKIISYMLLSVGIYLAYSWGIRPLLIPESLLSYFVSGILLVVFVLIVYIFDGRYIRQIIQKSPIE